MARMEISTRPGECQMSWESANCRFFAANLKFPTLHGIDPMLNILLFLFKLVSLASFQKTILLNFVLKKEVSEAVLNSDKRII